MKGGNMRRTKRFGIHVTVFGGLILALALSEAAAYYSAHKEPDSGLFFKTYPHLVGTRLDGCDVCHIRSSALPPGQKSGTPVPVNSCDTCHTLTDYGRKSANTLTPYGADYLKHGRNAAALAAIEKLDSDGDGALNGAELAAMSNPGDRQSVPGQKNTAHVILSYDELIKKGVSVIEQALFVNVAKSRDGDSYADIRGFPLIEVLEAAGMSEKATSVDVISLDGYASTFSIDQLRWKYPQAAPVFGLGKETLGECGWVRYEAKNLKEGVPLPDAVILLSFEENGQSLAPASMDAEQRLTGRGPFRIAAPQMYNPGFPDISVNATEECVQKIPERYRYNRYYEKNADYCVKAVVAIRVNPLPPGETDIDWPQYAKKAIEGKSVVVFGALRR
ncbi:MAG: hypothetical protein LBJ21_07365 [Acidobacteriota bacterium]|nr:hypothetical protein [Acidobacteriota bacterium]